MTRRALLAAPALALVLLAAALAPGAAAACRVTLTLQYCDDDGDLVPDRVVGNYIGLATAYVANHRQAHGDTTVLSQAVFASTWAQSPAGTHTVWVHHLCWVEGPGPACQRQEATFVVSATGSLGRAQSGWVALGDGGAVACTSGNIAPAASGCHRLR